MRLASPVKAQDRRGLRRGRQFHSPDQHDLAALAEGHERGIIEQVDIARAGAAMHRHPILRLIEGPPQVLVAADEQGVDPAVARCAALRFSAIMA